MGADGLRNSAPVGLVNRPEDVPQVCGESRLDLLDQGNEVAVDVGLPTPRGLANLGNRNDPAVLGGHDGLPPGLGCRQRLLLTKGIIMG